MPINNPASHFSTKEYSAKCRFCICAGCASFLFTECCTMHTAQVHCLYCIVHTTCIAFCTTALFNSYAIGTLLCNALSTGYVLHNHSALHCVLDANFTLHCFLKCTVHCTVRWVCTALYCLLGVHCTVYWVCIALHCILGVHCTVYYCALHCILGVHCTVHWMCIALYTRCALHCFMGVHCNVYSVCIALHCMLCIPCTACILNYPMQCTVHCTAPGWLNEAGLQRKAGSIY